MQAIKVSDKVYWVGAIDWNIRDFHGYSTNKGSTYNAFLIVDKKVTLIDTVKKDFYPEMLSRIASVIDPAKIDIIVSNHAEMDHSGSLVRAMQELKPSHVYASAMGVQNLKAHFGQDINVEVVANNSSIDIGEDSLTFIESRMLHWPDSMVTLLKGENILFCNDIFGMHYASTERFDDEVTDECWVYEAKKYYANIILPYSKVVAAFLANMKKTGLSPKIICPDHGFLWRANPGRIIDMYTDFAAQKSKKKAVVVYDTMWGSTEAMAARITDGIVSTGVEVKEMPLHSSHRSDVITELLDSSALVVGSPVLNQELFPTVADVTTYMRGLKKENLVGAAFGSYGWSEGPFDTLEDILKSMKVEIVAPTVKSRFVPTKEKLDECFNLGVAVGKAVLEKIK